MTHVYKENQAGSRKECHTEYSITRKTDQNRQCSEVDEEICTRVPQEQYKAVSERKCEKSHYYEELCHHTTVKSDDATKENCVDIPKENGHDAINKLCNTFYVNQNCETQQG